MVPVFGEDEERLASHAKTSPTRQSLNAVPWTSGIAQRVLYKDHEMLVRLYQFYEIEVLRFVLRLSNDKNKCVFYLPLFYKYNCSSPSL